MAHEIAHTTGVAAVFTTGEPAWHRLGTVIERATPGAEAIELAGLDWRVEPWRLGAFDPDVRRCEANVPDLTANVHADTRAVLGVVGRRYRVFQNREAFDFMDALLSDRLAICVTAGGLHGGRRVWMMARIPRERRARPDDLIKPYLLMTNTHDGGQAIRVNSTTVRVVCQNTLNLALREFGGEGLTISHHPRLERRVAEARAKLGVVAARFDCFDEERDAMFAEDQTVVQASRRFRTSGGADGVDGTDRRKKAREKVYGLMLANFDNDRNSLPGVRHTAWDAYNAVGEWADHQRSHRGADKRERRLDSIWFDVSHRLKTLACRGAMALATGEGLAAPVRPLA